MRPYAVRYVSRVIRDRERFTASDYVLVEQGDFRRIARILGMAECFIVDTGQQATSVVRMWCDCVVEPYTGTNGEMWARKGTQADRMLVRLEDFHLTLKTQNSHDKHDVYA